MFPHSLTVQYTKRANHVYPQAAKRGLHGHGGHGDHPEPQRGVRLRSAAAIGATDRRPGATSGLW